MNKTALQVVSVRKATLALFARGNADDGDSDSFFFSSPSSFEQNGTPVVSRAPRRCRALISVAAFGIRRPSGSQTKV